MPCGKCNYTPKLIAWPHIFKPGHPAGQLPWAEDTGTVDGIPLTSFVPTTGFCAVTLRVQVANILPGDVVAWHYSEDGLTWHPISSGPIEWGLSDGQSYIDYSESTEPAIRKPLAEGQHYWKVVVSRDGCSDMDNESLFHLETVGATSGTVLANAWKTKLDEPSFDIKTNGLAGGSINAAFYAYAQQTGYETCVGEESLIPALPVFQPAYLVLDCPAAEDIVKIDCASYLSEYGSVINHLDTMSVGNSLGSLYHDQYGATAYYTVVATQGIDQVNLFFFDLYGRLVSVPLMVYLQCDVNISDLCGPCSIRPNWKAALCPYFKDDYVYENLALPWADTGATIDGTAASSYKPSTGLACATLRLQAVNILPGDSLQWEYSADGVTWFNFGTGPIAQGMDGSATALSLSLSTENAMRLPLTDGKVFWYGLTIEREGCELVNIRKKVQVEMTGAVGTSKAAKIELYVQSQLVSTVDGQFLTVTEVPTNGITGLETYIACEGGCDPIGGGVETTGTTSGQCQSKISALLDEVSNCMDRIAETNFIDTSLVGCG